MTYSYNPIPPGCESLTCAHGRAWEYYVESIYPGNEFGFMSNVCTSFIALSSKNCKGERHPMGIACPNHIRGILFLNTNSNVTYGLNSKPTSEIICSEFNVNKTGIIY